MDGTELAAGPDGWLLCVVWHLVGSCVLGVPVGAALLVPWLCLRLAEGRAQFRRP